MDGTTVNTINSIAYFANNALKKFGLDPIATERYKTLVGNGASILVSRMIEERGGTEKDFENVFTMYNKTYDDNFLYLTEPYEGIPSALKELKKKGIKLAILSNKPHSTTYKISRALFGDMIDICYGGRENIPLKPDPQAVHEIMNELNVTSEECIFVGDTKTDIQTGKNSGIYSVGVLWGFRDKEELENAAADEIISEPSELLNILNKKNN